MTSEWFKDWFDTDEYLYVYRKRNDEDAKNLVELILNNVEMRPHDNILDLACGTGRHSILFAEKGYVVMAVDLSKNLLAIAQKSAEEFASQSEFYPLGFKTIFYLYKVRPCYQFVYKLWLF